MNDTLPLVNIEKIIASCPVCGNSKFDILFCDHNRRDNIDCFGLCPMSKVFSGLSARAATMARDCQVLFFIRFRYYSQFRSGGYGNAEATG